MFLPLSVLSTHNRAGEITYVQLEDLTFEITITTFTNTQVTSSGWPPVDRPTLDIDYGDNVIETIPRIEMIDLPDYYRKNTYVATHTFPGPGTYQIVVEDPNRNEGVANMDNSVGVVFTIMTTLQISPTLGMNSTPVLLSPPVDKAALNRLFIHNPAAWDPDGDSLSYKLTECLGENGEPIESFEFPDNMTINETTGDLIWNFPEQIGIYNVAILIEEWRQSIKIGEIIRDMQIEVYDTENMPPEAFSEQEFCLIAGDTLEVDVKVIDPDGDGLVLTPLGGPFEMENGASMVTFNSGDTTVAKISWITTCTQIRKQPYLLVIKAEDQGNEISLADLHHIQVWVNGPKIGIENLAPGNNSISLRWNSGNCSPSYYDIYRAIEPESIIFDPCSPGMPNESAYNLIYNTSDTTYLDNDDENGLLQGYEYCYRVVPHYYDADGFPSDEVCTTLVRGEPVITNVSILNTDKYNGSVQLNWSKPTELDTIEHPGPYWYHVFRSEGIWGESFGYDPIQIFDNLNDTIFTDSNLNTLNNAYSYKVEMHNSNGLVTEPMVASSIFLEANGGDNTIELEIQKNTPWLNEEFEFYQVNNHDTTLISIENTDIYTHTGLLNGQEYSYLLKTVGRYTEPGFVKPIINFSQIATGIPVDTIPPNPPEIILSTNCDDYYNLVSWLADVNEVVEVQLFYSATTTEDLTLLQSFNYPDSLEYHHLQTIRGCYEARAVDSAANISEMSAKVCVDSCDNYRLPNIIMIGYNNESPNIDIFRPLTADEVIARTIVEAEIHVYNRWGVLVYHTTDPIINWDGKDRLSNNLVSTGVYYYVCNLKEKRISGIEERYVVGFVHVYVNK
jgi:hypothetical protein